MREVHVKAAIGLCFVLVAFMRQSVSGLDNQNTLRYDGEVNIGKDNYLRSICMARYIVRHC